MKINDFKKLGTGFWLICFDALIYYSSFTASITIGTDEVKTSKSKIRPGDVITVQMLVIAFSMPILGILIDKIGKRLHFSLSGALLNFTGHLMYYFGLNPYLIFIFYGLSYSLFIVSEWSALAYIVEPAFLSYAYGIMTCFMNVGYCILPLIISKVHVDSNSYEKPELIFLGLAFISILLRVGLLWWDNLYRQGILSSVDASIRF